MKDIASDLTDAMTDWANGSIDKANELSARISWSIDQLNGIMDDAVDLMDDVDDLVRELKKLRPQLESAAGNAAGGTDVCRNPLQCHNGTSTGFFCNMRLLRSGYVHDNAAF